MSFQAYLDNIHAKTSLTSDDFKRLAEGQGFTEGGVLKPTVKAGAVVDWLKADYDLGRGHAMAIYALLKGMKSPGDA